MYYANLKTPLGEILITANQHHITGLYLPGQKRHVDAEKQGSSDPNKIRLTPIKKALKQLQEYFVGKRQNFDLPIEIAGTPFQKKVWKMLESIPYGKTKTYGEIAKLIKHPKAFRAVGLAMNKNLIGILLPCHRVIGAGGKLTGYAGGLQAKAWLLEHEGAI